MAYLSSSSPWKTRIGILLFCIVLLVMYVFFVPGMEEAITRKIQRIAAGVNPLIQSTVTSKPKEIPPKEKIPLDIFRTWRQLMSTKVWVGKCQDITQIIGAMPTFDRDISYQTKRRQFQEKLKQAGGGEGHTGDQVEQTAFYRYIANQSFVHSICETGFNAGHSAFTFLTANSNAKVHSFDIGAHGYSRIMAQFLQEKFPGRLQVTFGDSTKTLPNLRGTNLTCNVIVVDGGHSFDVAISDLINFRPFVNRSAHIIIIDDTPCVASYCIGVNKAWGLLANNGIIEEVFNCSRANRRRAFTVGYYRNIT